MKCPQLTPSLTVSHPDELATACRLVSNNIGESWRSLYLQLPFIPPRDKGRKEQDIEKIYFSCLRRDQTLTEQAWESLVKWRVFNRQRKTERNVGSLVKVLKKMDKYGLAKQVEKQCIQKARTG